MEDNIKMGSKGIGYEEMDWVRLISGQGPLSGLCEGDYESSTLRSSSGTLHIVASRSQF